jgi:hypothetical protein
MISLFISALLPLSKAQTTDSHFGLTDHHFGLKAGLNIKIRNLSGHTYNISCFYESNPNSYGTDELLL